jgi:hypothetical protein
MLAARPCSRVAGTRRPVHLFAAELGIAVVAMPGCAVVDRFTIATEPQGQRSSARRAGLLAARVLVIAGETSENDDIARCGGDEFPAQCFLLHPAACPLPIVVRGKGRSNG